MTKPMHILQVLLSPRIGGAETLAFALENEWETKGIKCTTIYLDDINNKLNPAKRFIRLKRQLHNIAPTHVLSHSFLPNLYVRMATSKKIPVLAVLHSASDDHSTVKNRVAERFALNRHSSVIAVSETQASKYLDHFGVGVEISVIPNGISPTMKPKEVYSSDLKDIVSIGRIAPQKNVYLWISICDRLSKNGFKFQWWGPISDGKYFDDIRASAKNLNYSSGEFCGPTLNPHDVLRTADAFLHTADREAHSIGILEAAATGLPVICSEAVAMTLPSGLPWRTFPNGDVSKAAQALESLQGSWTEACLHAASLAPEIRLRYSMERCAKTYLMALTSAR